MARSKDAGGKVEIFLADSELAYFDDLKGEMSRPALARILIEFALRRANEALNEHGALVMARHRVAIDQIGARE